DVARLPVPETEPGSGEGGDGSVDLKARQHALGRERADNDGSGGGEAGEGLDASLGVEGDLAAGPEGTDEMLDEAFPDAAALPGRQSREHPELRILCRETRGD